MTLYDCPADLPFLDTLARAWLDAHPQPERGLILLPTRRAARELAIAFLNARDGAPMLLPRITAIGALDEAPLALTGALDLPAAIAKPDRAALLCQLILGLAGRHGAPSTLDRAWPLAVELAALIDEAAHAGVDLARSLPRAVDSAHAEHWRHTLDFLSIVTHFWPEVLSARGEMDPAAHQVALLDAQARAWTAAPPDEPVWAAGIAYYQPAVGRLLRAVAAAPRGRVVLQGVDLTLSEAEAEAEAEALPPHHPQANLTLLLAAIGARRAEIRPLAPSRHPARAKLLADALLPDTLLARMRPPQEPPEGLFRLRAADPQQEAMAIAMILRQALETPAATAALVTPDRALAARVTAALDRFGIVADDSAGEPIADTPPGSFLRLLAVAIAERLAPVPLLALLKHPLCAAGLAPSACRLGARALERAVLRGPRPLPGMAGLKRAVDQARHPSPAAQALLAVAETCLEPALRMSAMPAAAPDAHLSGLIEAAERLAGSDRESGPARLWSGEDGEALATLLAETRGALTLLAAHDMRPETLPGLLEAVLAGTVVRSRRALRGRDAVSEHPRVFIWGLVEAQLQSADTIVLGGLAEQVWPPAADPGPWMSRPMRKAIGLASPEQRVGQAAHDFVLAACAAPVAVLACPERRDHAPAVPSRLLTRLQTLLRAGGMDLAEHPAAAWAEALDQPLALSPEAPPAPCPPVSKRPRRLSVSDVEEWRGDPYATYARHILRLRPLDPLDADASDKDYGIIVHDGLHRFLAQYGSAWPARAADRLFEAFAVSLQAIAPRAGLQAWWLARLRNIAVWIAAEEIKRRSEDPPLSVAAEIPGAMLLEGPGGPFELHARADRIETHADGRLTIIDYKTATLPAIPDIETGYKPQLPLEAAIAEAGGFTGVKGTVAELLYWNVKGGAENNKVLSLGQGGRNMPLGGLISASLRGLRDTIAAYDRETQPYLAQPNPSKKPRYSKFAQLSRAAEWAGDDDDGGSDDPA
jgi:ATP-dependent helicase/nuclease subunit B